MVELRCKSRLFGFRAYTFNHYIYLSPSWPHGINELFTNTPSALRGRVLWLSPAEEGQFSHMNGGRMGMLFIKAPFSFSLLWICPHPFLQGPHARKHFLPPHWPAAKIPACLATEQVQVMTYPYDSFSTQSEEFGCYFPSLDYKAVREACYSNDGGIGSLTSAGCQILFQVENRIHFCLLASVTLSLPRR